MFLFRFGSLTNESEPRFHIHAREFGVLFGSFKLGFFVCVTFHSVALVEEVNFRRS